MVLIANEVIHDLQHSQSLSPGGTLCLEPPKLHPSKSQIDNINKEINKIVKRDKKTSMDMIHIYSFISSRKVCTTFLQLKSASYKINNKNLHRNKRS